MRSANYLNRCKASGEANCTMQHDDVIWSVINHGFCSFKVKTQTSTFCRNEYNVSGLCNRSSCPLANSRYATLREHDGVIYLYIKTIERAHTPAKLWEKIKLPANYMQALAKIDEELKYFPKFLQHKNKQRLTKIHQYLIRMRKLRLKTRPKLVRVNKKKDKRDLAREQKALVAANLDKAIEDELLSRLKSGTYPENIYNFPEGIFNRHLNEEEVVSEEEAEEEVEYDEDDELSREFVEMDEDDLSDMEEYGYGEEGYDDSEDESDLDDIQIHTKDESEGESSEEEQPKRKKARRGRPRVEIEYEHEQEQNRQLAS